MYSKLLISWKATLKCLEFFKYITFLSEFQKEYEDVDLGGM